MQNLIKPKAVINRMMDLINESVSVVTGGLFNNEFTWFGVTVTFKLRA